MNTDIRNTSSSEDINQQERITAGQIGKNQQFGRMPERHRASFSERYHYHYVADDSEQPDERED